MPVSVARRVETSVIAGRSVGASSSGGVTPRAPLRVVDSFQPATRPSPEDDRWRRDSGSYRNLESASRGLPFPRLLPYTMGGVTRVPSMRFEGGVQVAGERRTISVGGRNISVLSPQRLDHRQGVFHTPDQVARALAILPAAVREQIREVRINPMPSSNDAHWAAAYHQPGFRSYMTCGKDGVVDIYPTVAAQGQPGLNRTLIHEAGHALSFKRWGEDSTSSRWKAWAAAGRADNVVPSDYARSAVFEDFSETLEIYALVRGGPLDARFRREMPNRFALLDGIVGTR